MDKSQIRIWASKLFSYYACLPSPVEASIRLTGSTNRTGPGLICNLYTKWKILDATRNDSIIMNVVYHAHYDEESGLPHLIHNTLSESFSSFGSSFPYSSESGTKVLCDIEEGQTRVFFTEYSLPSRALSDSGALKASAAIPGTFANVFSLQSGRLMKTIKLPTEDAKNYPLCHGKVLASSDTSVPFSACRFCPTNSKKIVYLAEYMCNDEGKKESGKSENKIKVFCRFHQDFYA